MKKKSAYHDHNRLWRAERRVERKEPKKIIGMGGIGKRINNTTINHRDAVILYRPSHLPSLPQALLPFPFSLYQYRTGASGWLTTHEYIEKENIDA